CSNYNFLSSSVVLQPLTSLRIAAQSSLSKAFPFAGSFPWINPTRCSHVPRYHQLAIYPPRSVLLLCYTGGTIVYLECHWCLKHSEGFSSRFSTT
ncbi:hypothetical protein L9F63_006897, partial [Diploptera punctata]